MLYWDKLLTPKRFRDTTSVQRTTSDNRSPFKKDFDTICNSTVLRRLQDKAQIFPLEQEDYARTRLTHSIEVMSVASSLAVQATKIILGEKFKKYLSENSNNEAAARNLVNEIPTILNDAALLHDMGNPPFGHLGEQIISDWFCNNLSKIVKKSDGTFAFNDVGSAYDTLAYKLKGKCANDLMNFEGNAQLLRLVTKLCYVVDQNGMNLTYPVLASFIKYPCSSSNIDRSKLSTKKTGYFTSEENIFTSICENLGLNHCRHPLAFLLEAADDIAYLSADIEDAQHKGIVSVDDIFWYLRGAYNDSYDNTIKYVIDEMDRYWREAHAVGYPDVDGYVIHRTRVLIKGIMIDAMYDAFNDLYENIMEGTCEKELIAHSKVSYLARILRKIEREKIYYSSNIVESKTRAFTIIRKLLDVYVPAVLSYRAGDKEKDTAANLLYLSLSENYRFICESKNKEEDDENTRIYNRLLLVTDQISGMTDSHAMTVYRAITAS